ncbi:DUF4157 domain-containing protein [Streptomyces luteireticuli]|uniref:eCIS core domain-containing protein n=1 Tax=Streptomyces luteireticuli TaxID=173858 RepID=UPI0035572DEB
MRAHRPVTNAGPVEKKSVARAVPASPRPTPADLLARQRAAGNAAVGRYVQQVLASPGRPLAEPLRSEMEARLGADFSDVRVHTGTSAQRSAAEIGARAYTSGNHVVIGEDADDRHVLAHELTHVIQQRQGPVAGTDNGSGLRISDPGDRYEREAEANATRVLSGAAPAALPARAVPAPGAGAVQRMPKGGARAKGKAATAKAPAEKESTQLGDQTMLKETVDGTQVTIVLDTHQNKHQNPKIAELGPYKAKMGTTFGSQQGLEWHRKNTAAFLLGCARGLINGEAAAGGLEWNWRKQGAGKVATNKKVAVDVNGQQVIFDAVAELKDKNLVITYHCNPPE